MTVAPGSRAWIKTASLQRHSLARFGHVIHPRCASPLFFSRLLTSPHSAQDIPGGHPYMLSLGILGGIYAFENPLQGCLLVSTGCAPACGGSGAVGGRTVVRLNSRDRVPRRHAGTACLSHVLICAVSGTNT